jgi:adenylate cyclase
MEKLALVAIDLAGYTRWAMRCEALEVAAMLERYYDAMADIVRAHGGRVVKLMGDGCFAVFPEASTVAAIDAALAALRWDTGDPRLRIGAAVHVATVATGEIGSGDVRRWDVIGAGVNHLFRMGAGAGLRLSEPAYRKLPSERRTSWRKDEPPATYHYDGEL